MDDAALFRDAIGVELGKVRILPDAPLPPAAQGGTGAVLVLLEKR